VARFSGAFGAVANLLPAAFREPISQIFVDTRVHAAHIAGRMSLASPLLGTGLGPHRHLYPGFSREHQVLHFAQNDYAQLSQRRVYWAASSLHGGPMPWPPAFDASAKKGQRRARLIDAGARAALAGIAAHSVFDWNTHAPANAFLACLIFGLCMTSVTPAKATPAPATRGIGQHGSEDGFHHRMPAGPAVSRPPPPCRIVSWSSLSHDSGPARGERSGLIRRNPSITALEHGERAARLDPANGDWPCCLAKASLHSAV